MPTYDTPFDGRAGSFDPSYIEFLTERISVALERANEIVDDIHQRANCDDLVVHAWDLQVLLVEQMHMAPPEQWLTLGRIVDRFEEAIRWLEALVALATEGDRAGAPVLGAGQTNYQNNCDPRCRCSLTPVGSAKARSRSRDVTE